jgi:polyhydroxyalkanoate synthase
LIPSASYPAIGDIMNIGLLMLKPFQLVLDKYIDLLDNLDKKEAAEDFVRMEKWIFDRPDHAGETLRHFVDDL